MANGRALLLKWLKDKELSRVELSRRLGVTEGMLSHWLSDDPKTQRNPGLENAVEIEKLTDGSVPVASWIPPKPPGARRQKASSSKAA